MSRRLAEASHDLQQPLQAMGLLIESLRKQDLPRQTASIVDHLAEAHLAAGNMMSAILDLSRLESGTVRLDRAAVRVDDLFAELRATFRPIAADKGVLLRFVPCSAVVRTDPAWTVRILGNLIANGLAHAGSDRIVVGCRLRGRDVRIDVIDRGRGIDPARLAALLSMADDKAGMGLAIAAAASSALGHRLEGRSAPGRGTAFMLAVPRADEA